VTEGYRCLWDLHGELFVTPVVCATL